MLVASGREPDMCLWSWFARSILLLIVLMLPACGGSDNSSDRNEPVVDNPDSGDTNGIDNQDPSILKVSDLRTLAAPDTPVTVYNNAGNGIAVWGVTSAGSWLYYSFYDRASDSWSRAERLADVMHNSITVHPQVVSNGEGFAVAWMDLESNLYVSLSDGSGWVTTRAGYGQEARVESYQLATDGEGYLLAWSQGDADGERIFALHSPDASSWGDATLIDEDNSVYVGSVQIESNGSGYAVVWADGEQRIEGNIYDGSVWQGSVELVNLTNEFLRGVNIASNGRGYSLVWSVGGESSTISNRIYTQSGGWSQPSEMFAYSGVGYAYAADIASNGNGYSAIITSYEHPEWRLYGMVDPQGEANWGTASLLRQSERGFNQQALVSDGEGYAAAWRHFVDVSGDDINLYYTSVYQDGMWNTPSDPILSLPGAPDASPIEMAGMNGQYAITWKQEVDGVGSIFARLYDGSDGWSEAETLESDSGAAMGPTVTVNPLDGLSVTWHQISDSGKDISTFSNQWDGNQWRGKRLVSAGSYFLGSSYDTRMIAADNGLTLAVWSQDRNGYRALFANIEDSEGWGQPIVFSDSLTETLPQIASNETGFAISWEEKVGDHYFLKAVAFDGNEWSESLVDDVSVLRRSSGSIPKALASNGDDYMLLYVLSDELVGSSLVAQHFDGVDWRAPVVLTEALYSYSGYPQIATNGTTYLAAWLQREGTTDIYSSQFDGEVWSPNQLVADDLEVIFIPDYWQGSPDVPQLASNGEGYGIFWFDREKVKASLYSNQWSTPEVIGDVSLDAWHRGETPSVVSNEVGYAVAWRSNTGSGSAVFANIYDGVSWGGAENLSASHTNTVMFDMLDNSRLIKASGEKYAVLWGWPVEQYSEYAYTVYAKIYDGTEWSATTLLNRTVAESTRFQLASDGVGFLAAWIRDNGTGQFEIIKRTFNGNEWEYREFVDENDSSKYDLNLLGGPNGYHAIWTREAQGDDAWVRIPWAKSGL